MRHALLTTTYIWLTSDRNAILVRNRPITLRRNSLCIANWNSTVKLFYSQKRLMKWYIYLLLNHFIWHWLSKGVLTKNGDVWNECVSIYTCNWPLLKKMSPTAYTIIFTICSVNVSCFVLWIKVRTNICFHTWE